MNRLTTILLSTAVIAGIAGAVQAQPRPPMGGPAGGRMEGPRNLTSVFDPAQFPETKGKVAQYTLNPRGEVDGLILDDGTEIQVPPHLSTALVFSVRPGDAVSIRGLKARAVPMVDAVTITNTATGAVVGGDGQPGRQEITGKVKATLHTPHGDAGGVLLEDGTVVRLPPPEATRLASTLAPGQTIAVKGYGVVSPIGKVIAAREIGPSMDKLTRLEGPRMHGWMGHGPHGKPGRPGPDGEHGPMPPPPPRP